MTALPVIGHIGVLTSGGDAPGMNAAIRAVVRAAIAREVRVSGILGGYEGLVQDHIRPLGARDVSNIIQRGGTMLRTARSEAFRTVQGREKAMRTIRRAGLDGLVVIGGDGTFTGAQALFREHGVRIIGLPGTIDNDLSGTDHTIGFDTAINTAVEAIDRIRDTASSHDRTFFVEVMGRSSGFIALDCAVAAGAEFVLVPELQEDLAKLVSMLRQARQQGKSSSIVVVAEGEVAGGAFTVADKVKAALPELDVRVSVIGHLQRGGSPSVADRLLAGRSGVAAVEALLNGDHDAMIGMSGQRMVLVPFAQAVGVKRELDLDLLRTLSILAT